MRFDPNYMGHFFVMTHGLPKDGGNLLFCKKCNNDFLYSVNDLKGYYIWDKDYDWRVSDNPWVNLKLNCNELIIKKLLE